jgi:hypothetical protein
MASNQNHQAPYDIKNTDAALEYAKQTRQLFARGKHDEAFDHYMRDPLGGASSDKPVTKQEFILRMYSMRDVQGNPVFPQPEGYGYNGFVVGMEVKLAQGDPWKKVQHVMVLGEADRRAAYVMVAGSTDLHKAIFAKREVNLEAASEGPSPGQYAALLEFSERHGRNWKSKLGDAWMSGNYRKYGVTMDQAALLQQVRNELGPEWLKDAKLDRAAFNGKDAEPAYVVSIYSKTWNAASCRVGQPHEKGVEIENETWSHDELVRAARKYGIDSASSPTLSDPYVWFKSSVPQEDRAHFEEGLDKYYELHIHEVNGREPGSEQYPRIAEAMGVKVAPQPKATASEDYSM